jgi:hypothetical protein
MVKINKKMLDVNKIKQDYLSDLYILRKKNEDFPERSNWKVSVYPYGDSRLVLKNKDILPLSIVFTVYGRDTSNFQLKDLYQKSCPKTLQEKRTFEIQVYPNDLKSLVNQYVVSPVFDEYPSTGIMNWETFNFHTHKGEDGNLYICYPGVIPNPDGVEKVIKMFITSCLFKMFTAFDLGWVESLWLLRKTHSPTKAIQQWKAENDEWCKKVGKSVLLSEEIERLSGLEKELMNFMRTFRKQKTDEMSVYDAILDWYRIGVRCIPNFDNSRIETKNPLLEEKNHLEWLLMNYVQLFDIGVQGSSLGKVEIEIFESTLKIDRLKK